MLGKSVIAVFGFTLLGLASDLLLHPRLVPSALFLAQLPDLNQAGRISAG